MYVCACVCMGMLVMRLRGRVCAYVGYVFARLLECVCMHM